MKIEHGLRRHGCMVGVGDSKGPEDGHTRSKPSRGWANHHLAMEVGLMGKTGGQGLGHCGREANQVMLAGCSTHGGDRKQTFARVHSAVKSGLDCKIGGPARMFDMASGAHWCHTAVGSSRGVLNWQARPRQDTGPRNSPSSGTTGPAIKGRNRWSQGSGKQRKQSVLRS